MNTFIKDLLAKGTQPKKAAKLIEDKVRLERFKDIPKHTIPLAKPYKDNSANEMTKAIIRLIKYSGGQATRINTMGVKRGDRWTKSTTQKGFSDIHGVINGKALYIEVKYGRDKLSDEQKIFLNDWSNAGGYCFVAHDFASVYHWLFRTVLNY